MDEGKASLLGRDFCRTLANVVLAPKKLADVDRLVNSQLVL
jgi:hypothetical protein